MEAKFAELTSSQITFLSNYFPKDEHFTSTLECKTIISKFGLDEGISVEDMQAMRNSVVRYYTNLSRGLLIGGDDERRDRVANALMSVTSVFDNAMFHKRMDYIFVGK